MKTLFCMHKPPAVAPNVTVIYKQNDDVVEPSFDSNITIHVSNSAPTTPVKSMVGTPTHCRSYSNEQRIQMAKAMILLESIDKHTKEWLETKEKETGNGNGKGRVGRIQTYVTLVYNAMAIMGVCMAMFFTLTMTYILWIGFYPPRQINNPFFLDRLYDFRDFLEGLQDGSIFQGFTDMLTESMVKSLNREFQRQNASSGFTFPSGLPGVQ